MEKYFTATPSRIGGIDIKTLAEETIRRHDLAYPRTPHTDNLLDEGGFYYWRADGEFHQINPEVIATLQQAVRISLVVVLGRRGHTVAGPHL